ncbi:hypothetical protein [Streptomyces sp. NPDC003480]
MKKQRRLTAIRLALYGALAVSAVATTTTAASANGWVHWKSEKYGEYLYSRANGNGARFGLGSNSAGLSTTAMCTPTRSSGPARA